MNVFLLVVWAALLDVSTIVLDEELASSDQVSASSSDHVSWDGIDLITDPLAPAHQGTEDTAGTPSISSSPLKLKLI